MRQNKSCFVCLLAIWGWNLFQSGDCLLTTRMNSPQPLWNATYTDKLRQDLLLNYDKFAIPLQKDQKITVNFAMTIRHLELNELKSTLTIYCWFSLTWKDMKLQWNSSEYGDTKLLHFAEHEIWQPDFYIYNSATSVPINYYSHTHFLAYPAGDILWVPATQFNIPCNFDLRYWPFDTQTCDVMIGSWTYHGEMLDIQVSNTTKAVYLDLLISNPEWAITNFSAVRKVTYYPCCPNEPYPSIVVKMSFARLSPSYKAVVIIPAFVIIILTILNFWLPPQAGEKLVINGTTALIITLYMLYFTQKLPVMGNHTPLIVLFYSNSLYLVAFSMVESVIVITLSRIKHTTSLPWLIKKHLTGKFGELLGLSVYIRQSSMISRNVTSEEMRDNQISDCDDTNIDENHMVRAFSHFRKSSTQQDWVLLAAAIDRTCFTIYCFIFVIFSIVYAI